jgi:hypothetical protein
MSIAGIVRARDFWTKQALSGTRRRFQPIIYLVAQEPWIAHQFPPGTSR